MTMEEATTTMATVMAEKEWGKDDPFSGGKAEEHPDL